MLYFLYDNTFEGLLTAVFDAYYRKQFPVKLTGKSSDIPLFTDVYEVITEPDNADRVLTALRNKISPSAINMLMVSFLYETDESATHIFQYIKKAFESTQSIELNFADPDVLELSKIYRKVQREEERIRQFVRFQKTSEGVFFACIEPQYNILPLSVEFFEDRFADQQWILYDAKRQYGIYYNLEKTETVHFENLKVTSTGQLSAEQIDLYEIDFQNLWRQYFKSTTIKERINLKLQRQHMPKRFWKYLTEKQC